MKVIFTKGLPGSGKTTWAKRFCEKNSGWVRINRDDLRNMRGKYWVPKQEDLITRWEDSCIISALKEGMNVIVDATNLSKDRNRERVERLRGASGINFGFETKFFDLPLEQCIENDLKRPNSVGEKVIRDKYDQYMAPAPAIYLEDPNLYPAVICDIDGTLAQMHNRGPFDWGKVGEDWVNHPVRDILKAIDFRGQSGGRNVRIILFSGRDSVCLKETAEWLGKNLIPYDEMHMRKEGDNRKDSIVKKEMFEEYVRGRYYVNFVLDDRDQVVDMWRKELGLTCLQVNYGNF